MDLTGGAEGTLTLLTGAEGPRESSGIGEGDFEGGGSDVLEMSKELTSCSNRAI